MSTDSLEQWRPVPGYPLYEVSDMGRVRSNFRPVPRLMRGRRDHCGYVRIRLSGRGDQPRRELFAHSLVLLAFVGPSPTGMEVRHLNGDPADNRLANLCYGTHRDNMRDKEIHGTATGGAKGFCKNGHRRTAENLSFSRQGPGGQWIRRRCLRCDQDYRVAAAEKIRARARTRAQGQLISAKRHVECPICANTFETSQATYCSAECRDEVRRRRRRELWRARTNRQAVAS